MKTAQRLDGIRLGIAGGLVWGLGIFVLTLIAAGTNQGVAFLSLFEFYPGYTITWTGSMVGFVWAFVDGFIGLALVAWFYNHIHMHGK